MILKIQMCLSEYYLQFLPDVNIVHFRFWSLTFQRWWHRMHFIPHIFLSCISQVLVTDLSHTCVSAFKCLDKKLRFIVLFTKIVLSLLPVLYLHLPKWEYILPTLFVFPNTFMLIFLLLPFFKINEKKSRKGVFSL